MCVCEDEILSHLQVVHFVSFIISNEGHRDTILIRRGTKD